MLNYYTQLNLLGMREEYFRHLWKSETDTETYKTFPEMKRKKIYEDYVTPSLLILISLWLVQLRECISKLINGA